MRPLHHDVTVVGGGIIGLAVAVALQQRGASVWLVDADRLSAGASYGNAGHLATEQVFPIADPSVLRHLPSMLLDPLGPLRIDWRYLPRLTPWMLRVLGNMRPARFNHIHQSLLSLNSKSLDAWRALVRRHRLGDAVKIEGSLLVAEQAATASRLQQHGKAMNQIGIRNIWLDGKALRDREPDLASTQIGALFYPDTGHVTDISAVVTRLRQAFVEAGGEVREQCRVDRASVQPDGTIHLDTTLGPMRTPAIVLATGAYAKPLVRQMTGVSVPLDTERGYHLILPHETGRLDLPVSSADRRFIMTPMTHGLRLAGTVEYAGLKAPPNMERARQLLRLAQPMLRTPLNSDQASEWMGFRPSISDSLPVIDRVGQVYLAFGHQHLGLTQAALTASLVTALYFEERPAIDLAPFRLGRF